MINSTETNKENAIFFAINDGYSFALANVLMSMKKNSPNIFDKTDIICYNTDLTDKNKELLKKIYKEIIFEDIVLSDTLSVLTKNKRVMKWGIYIIVKFFGFELVKKYKRVLHLDADILVKGDLNKFFELDVDMAWRKILAWNPQEIMRDCLDNPSDSITAPSGGVIYFTDKLNRFNIKEKNIMEAFEKIKHCKRGGIDELVIGYLAYKYNMKIKELSILYNDPIYTGPKYYEQRKSVIVHFLDIQGFYPKPWKSLATYLYLDEWRENNETWHKLGGTSPVDFKKEDYYHLVFDNVIKSDSLMKDFKNTERELEITRNELNSIKTGLSYRIGRVITWLPRKLMGRK